MKSLNRITLLFVVLLFVGAIAIGTLNPTSGQEIMANPVNWLVALAAFFLIIAFIATFQALDAMKYMLAKKEGRLPAEAEEEGEEEEDAWLKGIMHKLTDATPIEEEEAVATDHNYDGIRELDNNLPPWWLAGFYISILFAVVYLLRYHVFQTSPLQEEEFRMEMAEAERQKEEYLKTAANLVDESNVTMLTEAGRLEAGKAIFNKNCAVCHAQDGGGGVGPNLTDYYWIHGNEIADVFSTVKYGVPAKGMIPWQDQLSPAEMQEVSSFVLSLQGTEPANPKEPQGELMQAAPARADSSAAAPADSLQMPAESQEGALTSL